LMFPIIIYKKSFGTMQIIDFMKWYIENHSIQEQNKLKIDKNKEAVQGLIFLQQLLMYQHQKIIQLIIKIKMIL